MPLRLLLLAFTLLLSTGCAYRIGSGVMAGLLDESGGKGRTEGVEPMLDRVVERELLVELGHQLGTGLSSGATEISPEQRAELERTIESLLAVTTARAGQGLRRDVSPALREMVTRDIIGALSEGLRGDLSDSLESTVDRVITRSIVSLRRNLADDETRLVTAELLRDSIYIAMQEGRPGSPAVAETLQFTLEENVLAPFEGSVGGLVDVVAGRVDESARRTENTLKVIIGALVIVLGAVVLLYWVSQQRLNRERASSERTESDLRSLDAALSTMEPGTREAVIAKMLEVQRGTLRSPKAPTQPPPPSRSTNYER